MKIKSIAAAPGWFAVYKQDDDTLQREPLAAWAVIRDQEDTDDDVVGIVLEEKTNLTMRCDESDNFVRYEHDDQPK